jgi:cell wall-associated NlpC family hydrolase
MVVKDAVADVRAKPKAGAFSNAHDPDRETQLLKGEAVMVLERKGRWARIESIDQLEYSHHDVWEGYPGWVKWSSLSSDLTKRRLSNRLAGTQEELRKTVLELAKQHVGQSYLWGGRSLYDPKNKKIPTGVDCSGLISWSFWQMGWLIPRDSHEQWMKARPIEPRDLRVGDLVFFANASAPQKIVHVAIYAGGERILEAPQTGETVRIISYEEKTGKPLTAVANGDTVKDRVVYFGTFFEEVL